MAKTTAAKRLVREWNISVREVEQQLDADAYLGEQWQWVPSRLHHKYLCQQMFLHAAATGQSEHDYAIHWGQREPSPEWDLGVEPTTMELICPNSTQEDIEDLYWDVYQLWRLPGRGQCKEATEDCLHKEILDSIKECLWLKWPSAQLEGEQRQLLADVPQPDPCMEFAAANCHMFKEFNAAKQDSYKGMMALSRNVHQCTLVAVAFFEEKMEWMRNCVSWWHSRSHCHSSSCWCSGSHQCRRSRSSGHWREDLLVTSYHGEPKVRAEGPQETFCCRGTVWGWAQSPSPTRQKWWVTSIEGRVPLPSKENPESDARIDEAHQLPTLTWWAGRVLHNGAGWSSPEEDKGWEDLECPLLLEPHHQELLGGEESPQLVLRWKMAWCPCPKTQRPLSCASQIGYSGTSNMWRCWPGGGNFWRSPAMMTAGSLSIKCVLHLRCQRHIIGQRGWLMTTHPLAHPSIGKYHIMPPSDVRIGSKDYWLASHTRPSSTWGHFSTGQRRTNCQFLVDLAIWKKVCCIWGAKGT